MVSELIKGQQPPIQAPLRVLLGLFLGPWLGQIGKRGMLIET